MYRIKILIYCSTVICVVHVQYWNMIYQFLESLKTKYTVQQHNFTTLQKKQYIYHLYVNLGH